MFDSGGRKGLCVLLIGMLLLSSFLIAAPTNVDINRGTDSDTLPNDGRLDMESSGEDDISKPLQSLDASLTKRGKALVKVYVATTDVKGLADFLEPFNYKGAIGNEFKGKECISFLLLEIPAEIVSKISVLDGVIGVHEYSRPVYPTVRTDRMEMMEDRSIFPEASLKAPNEQKIWTSEYSGTGVKIAVCDSGVDFAHPDLWGAYARDEMIFEVEDEILIANAAGGEDQTLLGSSVFDITNESVVANATGGENTVHLRYRNLVDGSYDVYKNGVRMTTGYTLDIETGYIDLTNALTEGEILNVTYSYYLVERKLVQNSLDLYNGGVLMSSGEYTPDNTTGVITFNPALSAGDTISATYSYYSPYYGWPIAFDPVSMEAHMSGEGKGASSENSLYVNTSVKGSGPFESAHSIAVDGRNDFSALEGFSGTSTSDGDSDLTRNFDLTKLYVTRDYDDWYFGFPTKFGETDKTYSIYVDVDGPVSGGTSDPLGKLVDTRASHSDEVNTAVYNPNGTLIASAAGNIIKIWNAADGRLLTMLEPGGAHVGSLTWSPVNGTWLASANEAIITIWDLTDISDVTIFNQIRYVPAGTEGIEVNSALSFNANGTWLAIAGAAQDKTRVFIYDATTAKTENDWLARYTTGLAKEIEGLAFNPNGTLIAVASSGVVVSVINSTTGSEITLTGHTNFIASVAWSPDGQKLISGANGGEVKIWDVGSATLLANLTGHAGDVYSVDWSPDGTTLASSSEDMTVKLWSGTAPYGIVDTITDFTTPVYSVDFPIGADPNVVSGSGDTRVRTWTSAGAPIDLFISNLPDYVICVNYTREKSDDWGVTSEGIVWTHNNTIANATVYCWNVTQNMWDSVILTNETLGGTQKYDSLINDKGFREGFIELGVPRDLITENPDIIEIEMFVSATNISHAQDTVPNDINVPYPNSDWTNMITSLSNFARKEIEYYSVALSGDDLSTSESYRFGFHPGKAQMKKLGSLGVLVVDNRTKGLYERVYVDLNNDKVFDENDNYVFKGKEITYIDDKISGSTVPGSDGIPDYSAGTLYFIADGMTPIPYSDVYSERHGLLNKGVPESVLEWRDTYVPLSGEVVCFIGEFGYDEDEDKALTHGTMSAAVIAGRGNTTIPQNVTGMAPNATIIAISNIERSNIFEAWYFAVEGYDGVPGTGDEAVIVNNGFNYPSFYEDGWDAYSRYADYISIEYAEGNTLFVTGTGNDGYGYGTTSSPGACPGVVSVGAATDYLYKTMDSKEGPYTHQGDLASYSSRGPSASGILKPDVLAIGTGITDLPLNGDGGDANLWYNEPWEGTDFACAAAVGILSTAYEAYFDAKHLVRNEVVIHATGNVSALQLKHSPVIDVTYELKNDGTTISKSDYTLDLETGVIEFEYNITAGQWINATYCFYDEYPDAITARSLLMSGSDDIKNDVLSQGAGLINAERIVKLAGNIDGILATPSSWVPGGYAGEEYEAFVKLMSPGDVATEDFVIENANSTTPVNPEISDAVFQKVGEYKYDFTTQAITGTTSGDFINITDISANIPVSTELLKVTAHAELGCLDSDDDTILDADSTFDFLFELTVIDWNDTDANGEFDDVVNERNTFGFCNLVSNVLEVRVHDPLQRSHNGTIVLLSPVEGMPDVPLGHVITWTVTCEFYNRTDWDWLTTDVTTLSINGGGSKTLSATMNVPNDAAIGSYEGAIYITTTNHTVTIPVLVNVPADRADFTFGGDTIFEVTDEKVTRVSTSPIVNENVIEVADYPVIDESVTSVPTTSVPYEFVTSNPEISVVNEFVLYSMGGETIVELKHGYLANVEEVILSCVLYNNSVPMNSSADYTLNTTLGRITFIGTYNPLPPGITITANYSYYNPNVEYLFLDHDVYSQERLIPGSYIIYLNGTPLLEGSEYKISPYGAINLEGVYEFNLPLGANITAEYSYYPEISEAEFDFGGAANISIVPGSYTIYNNGGAMIENTHYVLDSETGSIIFDNTYDPLPFNAVITADYSYYELLSNAFFAHGASLGEAIVGGSHALRKNGFALSEPDDYSVDLLTGEITFTSPLGPGDIIIADYHYYDPATYNRTYSSIHDLPYGFTYAQLNYNQIVGGSYMVRKNGLTLSEPKDYEIDMTTGMIIFKMALSPSDVVYVNYSYTNAGAILFNNNGMNGGYGGVGKQLGDWRFYYMDIPDQGLNTNKDDLMKLFLNLEWDSKPSDIDIFVFGSTSQTTYSVTGEAIPSERYGPYTMENKGGSEEATEFYTATNNSQEIVTAPLTGGLNVIALHNVLLNGSAPGEEILGDVGWLRPSTDSLETRTNQLSGDISFKMVSNRGFFGGMNVSAVGPASGDMTMEKVNQDDLSIIDKLGFYQGLTDGAEFHKAIKVESALTLDVHIWAADENKIPDLDLGICFDANEDGRGQYEELVTVAHCDYISYNAYGYKPPYASCADFDADEAVKLLSPPDGQYVITVLGYTVKSPPQDFYIEVKAIRAGVEGFGITGDVGEDNVPLLGVYTTNTSVSAFDIQTYTMTWNFPGNTMDGEYAGVIGLGPSTAPSVLTVLANIIIDTEPMVITEDIMPSDGSMINDNRPVIMATIEDLERAEIDADSIKLLVDGTDVTSLAKISVDYMSDAGGSGYPQGTVTYTPNVMLSEGGHTVELKASDWAGNEVTRKWSFTVDTKKPVISLDSLSDVTYTNQASLVIQGTTEQDASVDVMIGALSVDIKRDAMGGFTATIDLFEGDNKLMVTAKDASGNEERRVVSIIVDTEIPEFDRLKCIDGTVTNQPNTALSGSMSEKGTMTINGDPTTVNSDGTFTKYIDLLEGNNVYALVFTDLAGNLAYKWFNVTLDTQAPIIDIDAFETIVSSNSFDLSGTTEAGAYVRINGKLVQVSGTRQQTGSFNKSITLSPGANTLVIESADAAGNINQEYITVTFDATGTNYGAIGLMVLLLIVGLLVGIFLARTFFGGPAEEDEVPYEEVPPLDEDMDMEGKPLDADEVPPLDEDVDMEGEPLDADEVPPLDEDVEGEPLDIDEEIEPIPDEDAMPEDEPSGEDISEPGESEEPEDVPPMEEEVPSLEEDISEPEDPPEPEPVTEELGPVAEEAPEEVAPAEEAAAAEEDPRIAKLTQAYEDGKISKELYEKNLAKFKGE